MPQQLKVVVPSYNSLEFLPKTLASIEGQSYKNYAVCVIDDASIVPGQRELITDYCEKNGWQFLFNKENKGALYNLVQGIRTLECQDEDVVVVIDGDDWLAHEHVFEKLKNVYEEKDIYLTWGQCEGYPSEKQPVKWAQPVPERVVEKKLFRQIPFVFWHPATFKYYLWRHIDDAHLRAEDGRYLQTMKDQATLFPMLEMAGKKIFFIEETLYIYNIENPLNDYATTEKQVYERTKARIRSFPVYETLPNCC